MWKNLKFRVVEGYWEVSGCSRERNLQSYVSSSGYNQIQGVDYKDNFTLVD